MALQWSSEVRIFLEMSPREIFLETSMNISVQLSGYTFNSKVVNKTLLYGVRTFGPMQFQPMQFQPLPIQPFTISTACNFIRSHFQPFAISTYGNFNLSHFHLIALKPC